MAVEYFDLCFAAASSDNSVDGASLLTRILLWDNPSITYEIDNIYNTTSVLREHASSDVRRIVG